MIYGRDDEVRRILDASDGSVTLIVAEPGFGKSALLRTVNEVVSARSRTITVSLTPVERQLPFSGLRALIQAADAEPDPVPMLARAIGWQEPDRGPNPVAADVAYAFATWWRAAVPESGSMVCVDDAQWLDAASETCLTVASRSGGTRWLFATRDDSSLPGLASRADRTIRLGPLDVVSAGRLAMSVSGADWSPARLGALHARSGGVPSLIRALASDDEARFSSTIAEWYADRLDRLDDAQRRVLAAAALTLDPSVEVLRACFPDVDIEGALAAAERSGLLDVGLGTIGFAHPVAREVMSAGLGGVETAAIHASLAAVVDRPDERAHHLALGTIEADDTVAAEIAAAGIDAARRGDHATAGRLLVRALELVEDPGSERTRYRLHAGISAVAAGNWERGNELLDELRSGEPSRFDGIASSLLVEAASALIGVTERVRGPGESERVAGRLLSLPLEAPDRARLVRTAIRLRQVHSLSSGAALAERELPSALGSSDAAIATGARLTRQSIDYLRGEAVDLDGVVGDAAAVDPDGVPQGPLWLAAELLTWDDRVDEARRACALLMSPPSGRAPTVHTMSTALGHLVRIERRAGHWERASEHLRRLDEIALATSEIAAIYDSRDAVWLHAATGTDDVAGHHARMLAIVDHVPATVAVEFRALLGFAALSHGDAATALEHLIAADSAADAADYADVRSVGFQPDLVEAAVLVGDVGRAQAATSRLDAAATRSGSPLLAMEAARAAVLVATARRDARTSAERLRRVLVDDETARLGRPFEVGRAWFTLALADARIGARARAATAFDQAARRWDVLGARSWTSLLEAERRRVGTERAESGELTDTERQVAQLVSLGRTNREVAAAMIVSVRTVESHLTRVYRKLGLRSRSQLVAQYRDR